MTIKECIDIVDNIKPNQYSVPDKVMWLSFIDEIIINDVLKTHEGYDGRYDNFTGYSEEKLSVPLIVGSPYDRLYTAYLKMKIDGENGETARYNNSAAMFNTYMMEYRKYYNKTHLPLSETNRGNASCKPSKLEVTEAQLEYLKRELYPILAEDLSEATSDDKIYAIVMNYVNNNTEMLSGGLKTSKGTVVSRNADFAEVAEWADGNPNNEDRTGYFVCANVPVEGIVMRKATSIDDVKGVSILAPAFAGNYTQDKLDSKGNLLPKYSYVAIIGFVPVIDNGTCTVGGRCMPDDNGCAIPSSNSMGYQVINRIDEKRVLIIIEPNGDMVQRIKSKIVDMQEDIDNLEEAVSKGIDKSQLVGQKTEYRGEIFNDYEKNIAGTRAFTIEGRDDGENTYTLNSIEGLDTIALGSEGTKFSIKWGNSYIDVGTITSIDAENKKITVVIPGYEFIDNSNNGTGYLFFVTRPELGDVMLDTYQHAEGCETQATLLGSHAEGIRTKAVDRYSHAEGYETEAHYAAHAEGFQTKATGNNAHAEGSNTVASGKSSHAEGGQTEATGINAHAEGSSTHALAQDAHAEGYRTYARAQGSHAEGEGSEAKNRNAHAEGEYCMAEGKSSHAEGVGTTTKSYASHAEGQNCVVEGGNGSHAEGFCTTAGAKDKHGAHAEGQNTMASGFASHAEGNGCVASHSNSHAGGYKTRTGANNQTVIGKYNVGKSDTLFEVGNGTGPEDENRNNVFEVKNTGAIVVGGVALTPEKLQALLNLLS